MNLQDLAAIGEFVGGLAVLITLIYLAIELRNNTKTLRADANKTSYIDWSEFNTILSQHPDKKSVFSLPVFAVWWKEERQQPIYSPEFIAVIKAASVEKVYFGDGVTGDGPTL